MEVALLGFGRFGRALGSLLSEARVVYRALDPAVTVPEAVRATAVPELIGGASLVVLAVPVPRTREGLEGAHRAQRGPDQVVLDVGSVKVHPEADARGGAGGGDSVGGAPIPSSGP